MASSTTTDTVSLCSEASTLIDGSVISTVPDRHGFLGGTQYSPDPKQGPPPETVLRREHKWLKMLSKWNFYMERNYRKVRERCRKGIPMSVRPRAWLYLCGGKLLLEKYPERYDYCLNEDPDPKALEDIKKDLHRQFPYHEMFISEDKPGYFKNKWEIPSANMPHPLASGSAIYRWILIQNPTEIENRIQRKWRISIILHLKRQQELLHVLKAYTVFNPTVGYCQAQAPVAAFLLMHMPAVQAFWCLVSISDRYLKDYYSPGLEIVQRDGLILQALLKKTCTPAYRHLKKVNAEPMFYCTEWFLCAFTRTLPWDSLLRIWDIFLCEGVKVLFKTALVILEGCLGNARNRKRCPGLCETLDLLRNPPEYILSEEYLVYNMNRMHLTERDFELEHQKQTAKRKLASNGASR